MFPDLGKYADTVLFSYAAALLILAVLVLAYTRRNARIRRALVAAETRREAA
ncbi:heme exporter protein CcmD [Abyssibius alkaniclasticus]|uniref:heme exporter protein CcmD n=1 Tax=Abyssibius alkaniclasticus TaxID=2881234 RepID=UPI002363414D|nr:heme exporter protein CcmD [Abyssibius alkaniclasticus]UPH70081.1 heme exporter protein CcmD [Abyssibius alkaniclasticus]|tara:strand:+ start:697 stop:852 length:156 start_codon:yes stop_codon:yes gene_type:complete